MKKLAFVLICALAIVASCSKKTTPPTTTTVVPSGPVSPQLALYQKYCKNCHGETGVEGRAPKLWDLHESKAEVVDIIKNGKGRMPALGGDMSNAEAEQIADYVLTLKKP